jgi:hypothetical protein
MKDVENEKPFISFAGNCPDALTPKEGPTKNYI